jgi:GNAT superfamily N-acetyltransferase
MCNAMDKTENPVPAALPADRQQSAIGTSGAAHEGGLQRTPASQTTSRQHASIIVRPLSATALERNLEALADLLVTTVNGGHPLGFMPPLSHSHARGYWLALRGDLQGNSRLLLAAYCEDRIVGTGQLAFVASPNARHRAELQKLFVDPGVRARGIGRTLMAALHSAARQHGRTLLLLNTRRGWPAEAFYRQLGYHEVGVIPGYSQGTAGERYDTVAFYIDLSL